MQWLRRRKVEERSYAFHPALTEPWEASLGLNYKTTMASQEAALRIADIYACCRCLSDAAASVPLIAYRRTDGGRQRLHSGFLPELLQRPSPSSSQPNLVGQLLLHLNLYGNGYIAKYRDDVGRIAQLGLLHPDLVEPELVAGEPRFVVTDANAAARPPCAATAASISGGRVWRSQRSRGAPTAAAQLT
jgi:phage portal protein BeeE